MGLCLSPGATNEGQFPPTDSHIRFLAHSASRPLASYSTRTTTSRSASRTFITHDGTRIHNGGQLPDEMFLPLLCCRCKYSAMPRRGLTSSQAVVYPRMYTIVKGTLFYIGSSTKEFSASCTFATISCCCRQCSMQRRLLRSVRASARCVSAAWSE